VPGPPLRFHPPEPRSRGLRFHLALDATGVVPGRQGLGRFQERLLRELATAEPPGVKGTVVLAPNADDEAVAVPPGWEVRTVGGRLGSVRDLVEAPRALRTIRPDVYLTTTDRLRSPRGLPVVLYLFEDPAYRIRAYRLDPRTSARQRAADGLTAVATRTGLWRAEHVVAASTSTARDLVFRRGLAPQRVSVALPGPFARVSPWRGASDDDPRVLAFVDRDPRDNGEAVVQAFARTAPPWRLDVVGDADPRVAAEADRLGISERVDFRGRLPQAELEALFPTAQIYLDVSLYEGYGFQAAEAAACGLPCVVSAVTSLPETTQHRALYVNPHDPDQIADVLVPLTRDRAARGAAGAAFDTAQLRARWPALVEHVLDACAAQLR
jgi:glycosyltransferase involved in cell wall biosynthesis